MKNAVIYARYSAHGQNEQTIDGQIRVCKEFAENNNINVVNIYSEKHRSGKDVNRPEFQKMIEDSKKRLFDFVIVYMLDRFARNRYYSTIYNRELELNGVRVISATEHISEGEEGEFYQMFLEWNAERYSKRLSKRVREGLTTSVINGTFTGGYLIYGYSVVDKKVTIDPDAADTVRFIFKQYAAGWSKKEIAEKLNEKGLRFKGKPFQAKFFDKMLVNPKYTGNYVFGGREANNIYPQIVDESTYNRVQNKLKSNKYFSGANSAKTEYLLQGKIFCGDCGKSMIADCGVGKMGKTYRYYSCGNRKKKGICAKQNEQKEFVEWYVVEQTVAFLSAEHRVNEIAQKVVDYCDEKYSDSEIKRIISEITNTEKEIEKTVQAMIDANSSVTRKLLDKKVHELSILLDDLKSQQIKLEFEKKLKPKQLDIINFINEFISGNLLDKTFQKRIIDNLVNSVYLYDDKIVIYFNVSNGQEVSYIGKPDTDAEIERMSAAESSNINSLSPPKATKSEPFIIFINGIPGIIIKR